jgi:hypothetical protein
VHRFFSRAAWDPRKVGLALAGAVIDALVRAGADVRVAVDDTLLRRRGKKVWAALWTHDGSAHSKDKIGYGNTWAVAAILVDLPSCSRPVALPVLARLWQGKDTASRSEHALAMVKDSNALRDNGSCTWSPTPPTTTPASRACRQGPGPPDWPAGGSSPAAITVGMSWAREAVSHLPAAVGAFTATGSGTSPQAGVPVAAGASSLVTGGMMSSTVRGTGVRSKTQTSSAILLRLPLPASADAGAGL